MTTAQNDDASHDSLGDELRKLYPGIIEQAQPPDRQQLLAEHPELADELRRLFDRFDTRLAAAGDRASIGARTPAFRGNDLPTIGLAAAAELDPTTAGGAARKQPGPLRLRYFGDYELLFEIARGGMGVVYKARQLKLNRDVAVKMILAGQLASADDVSRFHVEAEAAAHLDHPGIVPVYEVGEHEGCHFFSMGFVEGTSLAAQLAQGPLEPRAAAELMVDVCGAIQYAHEQGVIHRDLKPQNILLDKEGRPRVTDFGLAKRVAKDSGLTSDGAVLGTPNYMPPEQAAGHTDKISPAADVYSLGAVLYTALTGRPPFQAATPVATVMQVIHREPAAPRQLNAVIPRDLETIALKCLEKDPARRYATAGELGAELRRFLAGEPILARPIGPAARSWRWCRRHPQVASLAAVAALLFAVLLGAAAIRLADVPVARARAEGRVEEARLGSQYAAEGAASTVLLRLRQLAGAVEAAAQDPELRRLLDRPDSPELVEFLDRARRQSLGPRAAVGQPNSAEPVFESWFVVSRTGVGLARAPDDVPFVGNDFSWRDYFARCRRERPLPAGAGVHISRVYRSRADQMFKFAISAPVWSGTEADARLLGVLAASVPTGATLGLPHLHDERHKAVLVGRRDQGGPPGEPRAELPAEPAGGDHVILLHPAFQRGDEAVAIDVPALGRLGASHAGDELEPPGPHAARTSDDDYRDPVAARDPIYAGRWLAGFAPVGNTEFVVVVQQRFDQAGDYDYVLGRDLALWGVSAAVLFLALAGAIVYAVRHTSRAGPEARSSRRGGTL